jgi:hypothetical protein
MVGWRFAVLCEKRLTAKAQARYLTINHAGSSNPKGVSLVRSADRMQACRRQKGERLGNGRCHKPSGLRRDPLDWLVSWPRLSYS